MKTILLATAIAAATIAAAGADENGIKTKPKPLNPIIEKGFRPLNDQTPFGPPVGYYSAPIFQGFEVPKSLESTKPLIIKRLKWPHERSA